VQHLLQALSEMAHTDDGLAHSLWVLLLPIIWATLGEKKDQQVSTRYGCAVNSAGYQQQHPHAGQPRMLSCWDGRSHTEGEPHHCASVALCSTRRFPRQHLSTSAADALRAGAGNDRLYHLRWMVLIGVMLCCRCLWPSRSSP